MLVIGAHSVMAHWSDVLSGIPHGSIFGPILCIIKDTTIFDNFRNQHNININNITNKIYNFKIVHKYNITGGLSQKWKPTQSGIAKVICVSDIFSTVDLFQ